MKPRRTSPFLLALATQISSAEIIVGDANIFLDNALVEQNDNDATGELPKPDPAGDDLVLFTNGNLMHGTFVGINKGLLWDRDDTDRTTNFNDLSRIKQIVFKSARSVKLDQNSSFVTLVNGDRIPGEIVSLDDKILTLKSPVVGEITIPRAHVRTLAPNPFGGELHYIGPYTSDGWLIVDRQPTEKDQKLAKKNVEKKVENSPWIHSGDSFFSVGSQPLVLADAQLPDVGRVRFHAKWKGRMSLYVALHADLERVLPPAVEEDVEKEDAEAAKEENGDQKIDEEPAPLVRESLLDLRKGDSFQSIPWIAQNRNSHADFFGTCYTIPVTSRYSQLMRNYFSETGLTKANSLVSSGSRPSLRENDEALIEIRFDRKKALIMLFVDGKYTTQWNDTSGYLATGSALGFYNSSPTNRVRISEIVVSSWSGVTDSAASLENEDRDIVLLTNGTDRISGKISHIVDGHAHFKNDYTESRLPLSQLAQISFMGSALTDPKAPVEEIGEDENLATIVFHPHGRIEMVPLSATATTLTGRSPFLGEITTTLDSAVMLRFSEDLPDLADWFDDF